MLEAVRERGRASEREKDNAGRSQPALDELNAYEVECRVLQGGGGGHMNMYILTILLSRRKSVTLKCERILAPKKKIKN